MRKKIRFFRQHTGETCGISCILMLLDYYQRIQYPTKKMEEKLYRRYRCKAFCGVLGTAMAECLSRNRLKVRIVHASEALMENRNGYYPEELFKNILAEYHSVLEENEGRFEVEKGAVIDCERLRRELDAGRQIILSTIVPGDADGIHDEVLHWVLVYGYEDGEFLVCDPAGSKIRLTDAEVTHYSDIPVGPMYLTVEEGSDLIVS